MAERIMAEVPPPPEASQAGKKAVEADLAEKQPPAGVSKSVYALTQFSWGGEGTKTAQAGKKPNENGPPPGVSKEVWELTRTQWGGEGTLPEVVARLDTTENVFSPEFNARGREISRELVRLMTLPYEEKYDGFNNRQIEAYVRQWKTWVTQKRRRYTERRDFEEPPTPAEEKSIEPQDLTGLDTPENLLKRYNDMLDAGAPQSQIEQAKIDLGKYFLEAKRIGLFKNIDTSLKGIYEDMGILLTEQRLTMDEITLGGDGRVGTDRRIDQLKSIAQGNFRALRSRGIASNNLNGVWNAYIDLTYQRFQGSSPDSFGFEGEFEFEAENGGVYAEMARMRELFWRPTYASYYEVTARTEPQFQRAMETFVQWARRALSKDPNEVFGKLQGFKEAVTTAGQRANVDVIELRYQLEALVGVMGGDWANEHYNADHYYQFMWAATKDEGPERFVSLSKMGKGRLAALLWKLDKEDRFEMLYSPQGARGEFMRERNSVEMLNLQDQITNMLIEEAMGMQIKEYHPDDDQKRVVKTKTGANRYLQENLDRLVVFQSDEAFKRLFDGFTLEEQDRLLAELTPKAAELERKIARAKELEEQERQAWKDGRIPSPNIGEDEQIYADWKAGRLGLPEVEEQLFNKLRMASKIRGYLNAGNDPNDLEGEEKLMYDDAKDIAQLALELYGVMAEKAKRGAVFIVDRGQDQMGNEIKDYVPIHWAEKFVQFAENWTKATYGPSGVDQDPYVRDKVGGRAGIPAAELKFRADQARRLAIWQFRTFGYQAKLYDFTLLRDGKPVDINTLGYTKYGDTKRGEDAEEKTDADYIARYRYAVPVNSRILGYDTEGKPVTLAFDNNGRAVTLAFDDDGRQIGIKELEYDYDGKAVIYDKPVKSKIWKEGRIVEEAHRDRKKIVFDNLYKNMPPVEPMLLKTPRGPIDVKTGKMRVNRIEEVHADFNTATHHIYSRWTGHPYWGYQEEDTGMILTPEAVAAAKRIKAGISRPEDEEPHATQLLIVDPTLERITHFPYKESREDKVALAAVEESYQRHFLIQDELHEAFFPEDADDDKNRIAVIIQDYGGSTKEFLHARAFTARWTDMKARRARSFTPYLPLHWASMSEMWGAGSALGVLQMMNKKNAEYRMVGQFPMEKWVNQINPAQDVLDSLWGYRTPQEHRDREGWLEKPTNEADVLEKWYSDFGDRLITGDADKYEHRENQFLIDVRGTLGRLETTMHRIRVMESGVRTERGPLALEGLEIFQRENDGAVPRKLREGGDPSDPDDYYIDSQRFNRRIDAIRDSGSSRHSTDRHFWRAVRFLRSNKPGEGQSLYPEAVIYYELMDEIAVASKRAGAPSSRWEWLKGKIDR